MVIIFLALYYLVMLEPLMSGKADVVYGSRYLRPEARRVLYFWHTWMNKTLTTCSNMFTNLDITDMETCYKLFRRETIQGLHINEQIFYEDNPFTPQCFARAERVAYTAEPFYCYYERAGSISRKRFSVREFDRVTADRMRLDFYHEHFPQCEFAAAIAYIGSGLKVYYQSRRCQEARKRREQSKEELKRTIRNYPDLPFTEKQRAKAKLFLASPALYTASMRLRGK